IRLTSNGLPVHGRVHGWPRRLTASTRSNAPTDPTRHALGTTPTRSNSPPSAGSTGSTSNAYTATAETSRPPNSKQPTTLHNSPPQQRLEANNPSLERTQGGSRLTGWMVTRLRLTVWPLPNGAVLVAVETAVLAELLPPRHVAMVNPLWRPRVQAARGDLRDGLRSAPGSTGGPRSEKGETPAVCRGRDGSGAFAENPNVRTADVNDE